MLIQEGYSLSNTYLHIVFSAGFVYCQLEGVFFGLSSVSVFVVKILYSGSRPLLLENRTIQINPQHYLEKKICVSYS